MPATCGAVQTWLERLERLDLTPVTLLVVPGAGWDSAGIDWLRAVRAAGHELMGHGWSHHVIRVRGWRHRLHSTLISADVAEHLPLDAQAISALLHRCHRWFIAQGLGAPAGYVPPAWAMGTIDRAALRGGPFRYYETLTGIYDAGNDCWHHSALLGFEARRPWQAAMLRAANIANCCRAIFADHLRIAIHPEDHRLSLADDLDHCLHRPWRTRTYRDLFGAPQPR